VYTSPHPIPAPTTPTAHTALYGMYAYTYITYTTRRIPRMHPRLGVRAALSPSACYRPTRRAKPRVFAVLVNVSAPRQRCLEAVRPWTHTPRHNLLTPPLSALRSCEMSWRCRHPTPTNPILLPPLLFCYFWRHSMGRRAYCASVVVL